MPVIKATMGIRAFTNNSRLGTDTREGELSESWYWDNSSPIQPAFDNLIAARAQLLATNVFVCYKRLGDVGNVLGSLTEQINRPGVAGLANDIPQMAFKTRFIGQNANNTRTAIFAGIPDDWVKEGAFRINGVWTAGMSAFLNALNGWSFRARDKGAETVGISSIDAAGNMVLRAACTAAPPETWQVRLTLDSNGRKRGQLCEIESRTDSTHIKLAGWKYGACKGGKLRKLVIIYPKVNPIPIQILPTATIRKFGRPSNLYRGKRSAKR